MREPETCKWCLLDIREDEKDRKAGLPAGTPRTIEGPLYVAGAPLSRASLYREISSGNLSAVRSRAGILVREEDYARWLADATALHTHDPGSPDATGTEVDGGAS